MTWQFTLTGLVLGAIVGLTGVGGGSLMTPVLVIIFGFKPTFAVGTDIFHGAIFKLFGAIRHRRLGTVHAHLMFWMFAGSGPLSLAGVGLAYLLGQHYGSGVQTFELYAVGAALVAGGIGFLARSFVKGGMEVSDDPFIMSGRDKVIAFTIGAGFGAGFLRWGRRSSSSMARLPPSQTALQTGLVTWPGRFYSLAEFSLRFRHPFKICQLKICQLKICQLNR